jgi:hypothetical protein
VLIATSATNKYIATDQSYSNIFGQGILQSAAAFKISVRIRSSESDNEVHCGTHAATEGQFATDIVKNVSSDTRREISLKNRRLREMGTTPRRGFASNIPWKSRA